MRLALALLLASAPAAGQDFDSLVTSARRAEAGEKYRAAVASLTKALALRPEDYPARVELGQDYARLGRFSDAKREFDRAKASSPRTADAYIQEGYFASDAGDAALAERTWRELVAVDTSSYVGFHHLGAFLERHGRPQEAESYLRQGIRLMKEDPRARPGELIHLIHHLAGLLVAQGRWPQAESAIAEGLARSRAASEWAFESQFLMLAAAMSHKRGDEKKAESLLKRALTVCGPPTCAAADHSDALLLLADWRARAGRRAESAAILDNVAGSYSHLELEGDATSFMVDLSTLLDVADGYAQIGQDAKAGAIYRRILRQQPRIRWSRVLERAEEGLAAVCLRSGRKQEALRLSESASSIARHRAGGPAEDPFDRPER